ncbi:hypothetical protein K443DRAFT_396883 [Laccaria amethystina LaAM-08-1]|uniref:Unplaced genomic scaffold K443scaffold_306, whole genome shotgun sequence n=1 Tax=Laccaria amethystina LaAM-08-1 TaxID=1095629 RepID=A0A0C9X7F3_9AGAR|nr:hypothetical protein K443DRAFT_396883 [Laccaria amethystina LaAM-08-1]
MGIPIGERSSFSQADIERTPASNSVIITLTHAEALLPRGWMIIRLEDSGRLSTESVNEPVIITFTIIQMVFNPAS